MPVWSAHCPTPVRGHPQADIQARRTHQKQRLRHGNDTQEGHLRGHHALWKVLLKQRLALKNAGSGAGEGNRTLVSSLGSYSSTIELHPRMGKSIPAAIICAIEAPGRALPYRRITAGMGLEVATESYECGHVGTAFLFDCGAKADVGLQSKHLRPCTDQQGAVIAVQFQARHRVGHHSRQ